MTMHNIIVLLEFCAECKTVIKPKTKMEYCSNCESNIDGKDARLQGLFSEEDADMMLGQPYAS